MTVDLRSDTLTRPSTGMLRAMMAAATGDDVFGEDPTVNKLEEMAAELFAKEDALYCVSGTMSNQIAVKCHTQPGDEVICAAEAHVYIYEGGGVAFNSGSQTRPIKGDHGRITADQIAGCINPDDVHKARTTLVCLENTSNRGGGSCYDYEEVKKIRRICSEKALALHLDGARLFNALVARRESPAQYGKLFDSVSVCLNKGLGCPIGSLLVGSKAFVAKARRVRKVFGGGMRQAGFMAASGIYALENNIDRLQIDHAHAKSIGEALEPKYFVEQIMPVETNIVIVETKDQYPAGQIAEMLRSRGIRSIAIASHQLRFVTHLDINEPMIEFVIRTIQEM